LSPGLGQVAAYRTHPRRGVVHPRRGCEFYSNTAQFPPDGLSTAPAATAPRSPYRHLELCGIALYY
ncbi:MAG: hypothetical protein WBP27_00235, partial [Gemmiger qucibialis]